MQRLIVDCAGRVSVENLTPAEEAEALARVKAGQDAMGKEADKASKVEQARAKVIAKDPDLARALGWIE